MSRIVIFMILSAMLCSAEDTSWIKYVDDPNGFVSEKNAKGKSALIIELCRKIIETEYGSKIDAEFLISEQDWGFQVNFTKLKVKSGTEWVNERCGFGNIYIEKHLHRIKFDLGP